MNNIQNTDKRDQGKKKTWQPLPTIPDGMMLVSIDFMSKLLESPGLSDNDRQELRGWFRDI